jgi:hypothetical protein
MPSNWSPGDDAVAVQRGPRPGGTCPASLTD